MEVVFATFVMLEFFEQEPYTMHTILSCIPTSETDTVFSFMGLFAWMMIIEWIMAVT